jgi:hypothetical protein
VAGVPAVLLDQLAAARRRGERFSEAWPAALDAALVVAPNDWERREWAAVLTEMVLEWRSAWERRPASRAQLALATVGADPDRHVPITAEDVPPAHRECEGCGGVISETRPLDVRYCSRACGQTTSRRRRLAQAA